MANALAEAVRLAELMRGAVAFRDGIKRLSPAADMTAPTIAPMTDFFARVARGESVRMVESAPPRFSKSTTNEHCIAMLMQWCPGIRVIVVACTQQLADAISNRIKGLVVQAGEGLRVNKIDEWSTANGSSMRACGVGTALVGVGADCIYCDDLVPNLAAANSPTQTQQLVEWFTSTALGRLEPNASVLVCHHRWSVTDLASSLLDAGYEWCNIAALDVDGESSWPSRWSTSALNAKRVEVGEMVWTAMYQGLPRPSGGVVFSGDAATFDPAEVRRAIAFGQAYVGIGVDPATSTKTSADWSVILVAAFTTILERAEYQVEVPTFTGRTTRLETRYRTVARRQMNIIDVIRMRAEIPELVDRIAAEQRRHRAVCAVESVGGFRSVSSYLRRANPNMRVVDVHRTHDKLTAAVPAVTAWSRGDIKVPATGAPWLDAFVREVGTWTGAPSGNGRHDDQIDAMVTALQLGDFVAHTASVRNRVAQIERAIRQFG